MLIDDWDVWKFDYGDDTSSFQTAFNAYDFSPESKLWDRFFTSSFAEQDLILQGETMILFRDNWAKSYMKLGFETNFEGNTRRWCYATKRTNAF